MQKRNEDNPSHIPPTESLETGSVSAVPSFTEGDWRVNDDDGTTVYVQQKGNEPAIAKCGPTNAVAVWVSSRSERHANAYLAAAAPALYYALVDLVRQLPTDERLADFNLDRAEAALALATNSQTSDVEE